MRYDFSKEEMETITRLAKAENKKPTTVERMEIANSIISKYSMLKDDKGIFHAQLFSAMDDYLEKINEYSNGN